MLTGVLPPVSNDADFALQVQAFDDNTSAAFDLTPYAIAVRILTQEGSQLLSGDLNTGAVALTQDDNGVWSVFTIAFTASQMTPLCEGNYRISVRMTDDTDTAQLVLMSMPVLEGGF